MHLVVALLLAAAPDAGTSPCGAAPCEVVPSAKAALERVLASRPLVLAVGEYHEQKGAPKVKSATKRFTEELLPALKGRATALVAETWMLNGRCGAVEKQAAKAVEKTTQRPDTTEDEVTTLLGRAYELGLKNHILLIDCDDYRSMLDAEGELDPEKSLLLVRRKVEAKALETREKGEWGGDAGALLLYGGAIHNDLHPEDGWQAYSFGPRLAAATDGGYAELDLLVPEYVEKDADLLEAPWFAQAMKLSKAGKTVLVTPRPGVFLLLYPRARK